MQKWTGHRSRTFLVSNRISLFVNLYNFQLNSLTRNNFPWFRFNCFIFTALSIITSGNFTKECITCTFVLRLTTLVRLSLPLAPLEIRFGTNRFDASTCRLACTFARCHLPASVKLYRSDLYTLFIADVGFSLREITHEDVIGRMNSKEIHI